MSEENISQIFKLKNIDQTRSYLIEEINRNELMCKKNKKAWTTLNYIEHFLILASTIIGSTSISAFAFLVFIPIGITSSARLEFCAITSGIKKYQSIIKEKKKKDDKMLLLAKSKLNGIEVLISKSLIDAVISHHEFVLIKNELKQYDEMNEKIKRSNNKYVYLM